MTTPSATTPAPLASLSLNNENLPDLFTTADDGAIHSQGWHFAFVWVELVFVSLAAVAELIGRQFAPAIADLLHIHGGPISVAVFTISATELRNGIGGNIIAAFFMIIAILAFFARFWFRRAEFWRKQRALAEAIKSLAWRYVMHGISREAYLEEYGKQRQQSTDLRLPPPQDNATLITDAMEKIHDATPAEQYSVYLKDRLKNQRIWYSKKAKLFRKRTKWLHWDRGIAYGVGLLVVPIVGIFIAGIGSGGFAVVTTIAGGFATWLVSRHYDDLSQSYTIMAHKLLEYETRAANILPESQARGANEQVSWAAFVNEVETFLDGEHQVWLREIAQNRNQEPELPAGA
ncbi:MAG TPA: SLATT domain-containing protein [Ktedonobacterales bacterium]|nr:SLATT domain-containing protein [Ktedonobacterales bacterium]